MQTQFQDFATLWGEILRLKREHPAATKVVLPLRAEFAILGASSAEIGSELLSAITVHGAAALKRIAGLSIQWDASSDDVRLT